jgi:hypothetical protein
MSTAESLARMPKRTARPIRMLGGFDEFRGLAAQYENYKRVRPYSWVTFEEFIELAEIFQEMISVCDLYRTVSLAED